MIKTHGKYSVSIANDGAIYVKKNDWISKYSAALHRGDTSKIYEYGRIHGKTLIPIKDPNKIFTGEKIYHIPTYVLKRLEKPTKTLKEVIDKGRQIQGKINALKGQRNKDQEEIERLEKEVERLDELADDAAAECEDAYSCIGAGLASMKFANDARNFEKKANEIRKKVRFTGKTIEELEKRLTENLQQQKELKKIVEETRKYLQTN